MKKLTTLSRPRNEKERFDVELARIRGFDWVKHKADGEGKETNIAPEDLLSDGIRIFCSTTEELIASASLPLASKETTPIARAIQRADADGLSHKDNSEHLKKLEGWRAYALRLAFSTSHIQEILDSDEGDKWHQFPQIVENLRHPFDINEFDASSSLAEGLNIQKHFDHFDVPNALISDTFGLVRDMEFIETAQDERWAQCFEIVLGSVVKIEKTLLQGNIRLVWKYAQNVNKKISLAAALRAGLDGLDHAITRFESRRGNNLSTYATYWIRQRVKRTSVNHLAALRLPVHRDAERKKLWAISYQVWARERRAPQLEELANEIQTSVEQLRKLLSLTRRSRLSTQLGVGGLRLIDVLEMPEYPSPRQRFDGETAPGSTIRIWRRLEELTAVALGLEGETLSLKLRNKKIVWYRLGLGVGTTPTLETLGEEYNITRERVRQIQSKIFGELYEKWPQAALEDELHLFRDEDDDA